MNDRLFVATPSYTQICAEQARQRCCLNWWSFGRAFPDVEIGNDPDLGFNTNQCGDITLAYQAMYVRAKDMGATHFMTFEADMMPERGGHTFTTLWATMKERDLDHIAALYFLNCEEESWPLLYKEATVDLEGQPEAQFDHRAYIQLRAYPQNRMIEVDATGLGCTIIRMDALRRIEKESPYWREAGASIFKIASPFSVDMAISFQLKRLGYELWVHSGVIIDHISRLPMVITEKHYQTQFANLYWPEDDPKWKVDRPDRIAAFRRWLADRIAGTER